MIARITAGSFLWLGLALTVSMNSAAGAEAAPKMNVLFIAVDDLNCNLACYGHPVVQSPNIDKLAARGVRFERAYCQYPLCNPSRTSLLSGCRPDTTKILGNATPPRTYLKDAVFLPEHFSKHGYFTARVGKIAHGAFESAVKWDVSENPRPGAGAKDKDNDQEKPAQAKGGLKIQWKATDNKDEDEPDGRTARRIVELLEQNQDKTFFIAAGFHKPHLPFNCPKKYFDLYPLDKIDLPKEPADFRKGVPPIAFTSTAGDDEMTKEQKKQAIAAYYACTTFTDAQVGLIVDALDRLKLADKTIIVFWGDHGYHLSDHGNLWRKMTLFEQSDRVPVIVAAPGKKPAVSPRLVELVDLYPTLCDLCGLPLPKDLEGTSFAPLLDDPDRAWKKAAFTVVSRGQNTLGRAVYTERYRYAKWGDNDVEELYDHKHDPHEYHNLADDPKHADTKKEMRAILHGGWKEARPSRSEK